MDGKLLVKKETLHYEKEYERRETNYLNLVTKHNSFIHAELDFTATKFISE